MMAYINLKNADVEIPIYNANTRSLKTKIMKIAISKKIILNQGKNVSIEALKNITINIKEGDRLGVIGTNGSGKSTFLRLLNGVYKPTKGTIINKGDITSLIDLSLGIDPEATGRENIFLRGVLLGFSKKKILENMKNIINFSELGDFIDMPVRTYSTGMKMKLAFSVSTTIKPTILLMDEWLAVGDQAFKLKAQKRLLELLEETRILVIASHSRNLIEKTCNRAILLENGSIKMDGEPFEICKKYFGNTH
jgi:lipopolysaccharide transport system ATP-binding protein